MKILSALPLILLSVMRLAAFESWEHEGCSQLALSVVSVRSSVLSNYVDGRHRETVERTIAEFLRTGFGDCMCGLPLTYGRLTMLADYMPDPYSMAHQANSSQAWPRSKHEANLDYLKNVGNDLFGYLSASHNNHNHFQGRALFSFWMWHREAVNEAAAGNLWGAFLLNAYADHYLQDVFAPGHILAPRNEASDDTVSLALHDSFNRTSLGYRLTNAVALLPFLNAALCLPANSNGVMQVTTNFIKIQGADGSGKQKRSLTIPITNIQSLANSCQNAALTVECLGDGQAEVIKHQLPLMMAFCARSVFDLVESYSSAVATNSFPGYTWRVHFNKKSGSINPSAWIESAQISLPFGGLDCAPPARPRPVTDLALFSLISLFSDAPLLDSVQTTNSFSKDESVNGDMLSAAIRNPILGIGFGIQSLAETGDSHIRSIVDGDILAYGNRRFEKYGVPLQWFVPEQWGLAVGYSGIIAPSSSAHGPELKFIVPFSKVNARACLIAGARAYSRDQFQVWGDFESLRIEWGMHVGNLFLGVGHDHYMKAEGELVDGLSIEAGLSFSGPFSRIPILGRSPQTRDP